MVFPSYSGPHNPVNSWFLLEKIKNYMTVISHISNIFYWIGRSRFLLISKTKRTKINYDRWNKRKFANRATRNYYTVFNDRNVVGKCLKQEREYLGDKSQ